MVAAVQLNRFVCVCAHAVHFERWDGFY